MRVLLITAHPVEESFHGALKACIHARLRERHKVDVCDLYAEGFDPVMSREERLGYHDIPGNVAPVRAHVERLLAAQALVLCFPVWSFGPPAILKGWFDRVMLPGMAFHIGADGRLSGGLSHMAKVAGIATFGQTRGRAWLMGDYPRRLVTRTLRRTIGVTKPAIWRAHYAMNVSTPQSRARFLAEVDRVMTRF